MREILGTRAGHLPLEGKRREAEFAGHEEVFLAHTGDVAVLPGGGGRYKAGLSEHQGFHRNQFVAVAVEKFQREVFCQDFEGLGVQSETQCAGQCDVCRSFPVPFHKAYQVEDSVALPVKAFHRQGCKPFGMEDFRQCADGPGAGKRRVGSHHQGIAPGGGFRCAANFYLWNHIAVGPADAGVIFHYHVQYHGIIRPVPVMAVAEPVGCLYMDFDIADPPLSVDFN